MKKIAVIIFSLMAVTREAKANDGPYFGFDLSRSKTNHLYRIVYRDQLVRDGDGLLPVSAATEGAVSSGKSFGFGVNAGFKVGIDYAFIAPEIFYDQLNNSAKDFFPIKNPDSTIYVSNRFGMKMNFGYNVYDRFDIFVMAGVADVKYNVNFRTDQSSRGVYKMSPIYGVGLSYDMNDNLALKFTYDRQKFNAQYFYEGLQDKITLDVFKVGLAVNF